MVKGLSRDSLFFVWGTADKDGFKYHAALTQPVQRIWLHQTYLSCAVQMACIHARRLKHEMCKGTKAQQSGIGDFWTSDSPDEAFALSLTATVLVQNVQINNFSPGNLKGMSALTMLAINNLKKF